ncbi:hypothetical protein LTR08_008551 [Meristemomyces frigidus]|nr:hypothetical protein LTR08_008551 [Meristemomyces frigidus]
MSVPDQPPPSYDEANGSSSRPTASSAHNDHLDVPGTSSSHAIPAKHRRSMEDELRPLPAGWVRTFDPETEHQFFVDTKTDPPRSIWTHPYDDEQYLNTLSGADRERAEQESLGRGHPPSKADIMAEHTDDEDDHHSSGAASSSHHNAELPPRPDQDKGKKPSFGRKMKDKMTGSTHEERLQERKKRAEEEQRLYEQHLRVRQAMARAQQTGKPQSIGKDRQGKEIFIEPPSYGGDRGYPGGYGYNPYSSGGMYSTPNSRYIRPSTPYSRPYGYGYGGGYGMPLALGGGLMGGMMMGSMMGGGLGMGGMGMGMGGGGM